MASYEVAVEWRREGAPFTDNQYSRAHAWSFDGGARVPASSSPHVVPVPLSDPAGVDPEEAFVASLSSCHMLWFLSLAAKRGLVVDRYLDRAVGVMARGPDGKLAITVVTLRPEVALAGAAPSSESERESLRESLRALHHEAHEACFIASSVKTEVRCEPVEGSSGLEERGSAR